MILSDVCIKRPVFASVLSIMLVLLGFIGMQRLAIREYPDVQEPVVTVSVSYAGANPGIIETQVIKPLEESIAEIEGIEIMTSKSRQSFGYITVTFHSDINPDNAASEIRDRVSRVRGSLPSEVDEPVISKMEAGTEPIIYLSLASRHLPATEVTDYADRYIKTALQNIKGVANVTILGGKYTSLRLWLHPSKMASFQLIPQDIEAALHAQNSEIPSGKITSNYREFSLLSNTSLNTLEEFENVIIKHTDEGIVRLKDVARLEYGPKSEDSVIRFNGKETIAIGIVKQATANPLSISKDFHTLLPSVQAKLPDGLELNIAHDASEFIRDSVEGVYHTIFEAIILVIIVIFLFLRNIRATFIPIVTIPVSLIGSFFIMYLLGFSINTLTLLSMVLAVGLVVDDAIVILENIHRYIEEGMSPKEAAFKGSREIAFAIIAMTITLAAVYTPVALMTSKTGKLFMEFSVTLAITVLISGVVALTLSPMMCAYLLQRKEESPTPSLFFDKIEKLLNNLNFYYRKKLVLFLQYPKRILLIGFFITLSGGVFFKLLPSELAPSEDSGVIMTGISAPEGSTLHYTSYWINQLEPLVKSIPAIHSYFFIAGMPNATNGFGYVLLKPYAERNMSQDAVLGQLFPLFSNVPGIFAFPFGRPSLDSYSTSTGFEFVIKTNDSFEALYPISVAFLQKLRAQPGFVNLDSSLSFNTPQLSIELDRDKASRIGIPIDSVGKTLELLMSGRKATYYTDRGKQYDVMLQLEKKERTDPMDLDNIYLRSILPSNKDELISFASIASFKETLSARDLDHFNQFRSVTITASLLPFYSLKEAINFVENTAKELLPSTMYIDYEGEASELEKTGSSIFVTFLLALCFITLVLAAQFESLSSPFIILFSVPLSLAGALGTLWLCGGSLNIFSQIGLITLVGLITKHGILIVEFAHQLRGKGMDLTEAVIEAACLRLRPILMTTASMVFGAIPLAFASGAGAAGRNQIGYVITGGMALGTLFTLVIIPVIYHLFYSQKAKFHTDKI